jgi:hypothetical protein
LKIEIDRRPGQASGASADPEPITTDDRTCERGATANASTGIGGYGSRLPARNCAPGRDDVERFAHSRDPLARNDDFRLFEN